MKTVTVVQRTSDTADQFASWLRDAGYRVRVCTGPQPPEFGCWSYRFFDCPLWTQADLLIYDPWLQTSPTSYGSESLLQQEHAHSPGKPILIWGAGAAMPAEIAAMDARGEAEILPFDITREALVGEVERLIGPSDGPRTAAAASAPASSSGAA